MYEVEQAQSALYMIEKAGELRDEHLLQSGQSEVGLFDDANGWWGRVQFAQGDLAKFSAFPPVDVHQNGATHIWYELINEPEVGLRAEMIHTRLFRSGAVAEEREGIHLSQSLVDMFTELIDHSRVDTTPLEKMSPQAREAQLPYWKMNYFGAGLLGVATSTGALQFAPALSHSILTLRSFIH